ncbi:MAG TPA: hypothetical protein VFY65_14215 [Longimicrobium sp.]|nr:hypothetical protein [Longimicrobium sp.]
MGQEITRLATDKVDRAGNETLAGPLTVQGDLTVGAANKGAGLRVLQKQEDGTAVDHGAIILGTSSDASASLRLGYGGTYSWIQGQGKTALALNPRGGNVGIGIDAPTAHLHVGGDVLATGKFSVGGAATVTGKLTVTTDASVGGVATAGKLTVTGDAAVGGAATVAGRLAVSGAISPAAGNAATAGIMFPQNAAGGAGDAAWVRYYARSGEACTLELGTANDPDDHIALMPSGNVGIGINAPTAKLHVAGDVLATGKFSAGGGATVTGLLTAMGDATVGGAAAVTGKLSVTADASVGGTATAGRLTVTTDAAIGGAAAVTGKLSVTADASVGGTVTAGRLTVTTDAAIGGAATAFRLSVTADATVGGATTAGRLSVTGDASVGGAATVTGKLSVMGDVTAGGAATAGRLSVTGDATVGGSATVTGRMTVVGAIIPSAGNTMTTGIMFPQNVGGGAGDAAWVRYYARSGEACTLELGTLNDPDDHIALMPSGNVGIGTIAPTAKLHVEGDILATGNVSLSKGLFAPAAFENTRILRGIVNYNGDPDSGSSGFTAKRDTIGIYDITFKPAFTGRPAGVVTQIYPNFDDFGSGGSPLDNAVIVGINANKMRVKTGNDKGIVSDRQFCFIVIGPR